MTLNLKSESSVLLISGIYFPDIGGPATFIPKMAYALVEKNLKVRTLALTNQKQVIRPVEPWDRFFIRRNLFFPIRFIYTSLKIRILSGRSCLIFANGLFEEAAIASLIGSRTKVAKIVGDPIWERFRNNVDPEISLEKFNELQKLPFKYFIQRKLLVWSLNQFDEITTPSHQLANLVKNWGVRTDVKAIANGIQICDASQSYKEYDVITVSRLVTWKNIDKVIRICKQLELKLAIVGSGPDESRLRSLVVDDSIEFLGELNKEEVFKCLSKSKIFTLLSNYEGLSHSLLEAMNLEIPVIVSNVPGNTSIIRHGENGLVVNIENESDLIDSFRKMLSDPEYASQIAKNAKHDLVMNFDINIQLEKFIELLRK